VPISRQHDAGRAAAKRNFRTGAEINADRDHYANMSAVGSHLEQHLVEIARRAPSVIGAQLAHHRIVHPSRVDPRQHIPSGST